MILGTAGHVDHGKTSLVRALTGIDTDRLKEEKERGITIELGFARLDLPGRVQAGVVDVPGHEDFVRAMVAGAAGMDVVLMVVAADEGVMPQTREHLAIVDLLDVPELVVAITKCDLVEAAWLELVDSDVADLLAGTRYAHARRVPTSATSAAGLDNLLEAISEAADRVHAAEDADLCRIPLDRVFTLQGAGTVATGTLWSGTIRVGERARILPEGLEARVRSIQVHERDVDQARAGDRTAVSLLGEGADRTRVARGATLVTWPDWRESRMLTARVRVLPDTGWSLAHHQRVHVHLGTAEVLARCALLDAKELGPGQSGWVQLRLEEPVAARARDRAVIRAYSPVTTIGGAVVAETAPPKRNRLDDATRGALERLVEGLPSDAVLAFLELQGWAGATRTALPVHTGLTPTLVELGLSQLAEPIVATAQRIYGPSVRAEAQAIVIRAVDAGHAADPLRPSHSLAAVRGALPKWAPADLADGIVAALVGAGLLEAADGGVRRPGYRPVLSKQQEAASARVEQILLDGGLGAPFVDELPEDLRSREDIWSLLRRLEALGTVRQVADDLFLTSVALDAAAARIHADLGGQKDLGPAAFREVLPVTRKRLLPLLNYFDGLGTTLRRGEGRDVPQGR